MQHYPLARNYCGVEHAAVLEHIVAATALKIPHLADGPTLIDVTLETNNLTRGWNIRCPLGYLGALDAEESQDFPDLEQLRTMHVTTTATVEIVDGMLDIAVNLGLGPWQVPRNNAGGPVLAPGMGVLLATDTTHDVSAEQLTQMDTCSFFVSLTLMGETFVASAEDCVLGTAPAPAHVSDLLRRAAEGGQTLFARAYAADGLIAVDVPEPGSAEFFEPPVPALAPRARIIPEPPAADGTWQALIQPADAASPVPQGTRPFPQITHPTSASTAPLDIAAMTEHARAHGVDIAALAGVVAGLGGEPDLTWRPLPLPQAAGRYSSESARVTARRKASGKAKRHRKPGRGRKD